MFLIRSLERGGAESQLAALARALSRRHHAVSVVTLYGGGANEQSLLASGVTILSLGKSGRWNLAGVMVRLVGTVRSINPEILHGYLTVGNLLALAVRPLVSGLKVVWGVRSSDVDLARYDAVTRLSYRIERRLARFADLIVANSEAGAALYRRAGGNRTPVTVVPNGFDTESFAPDPSAGARIRGELGIAPDELVIGMVARIDAMKDHDTFLDAAALASRQRSTLRFVCVGGGPDEALSRLRAKAESLGIDDRVTWTGERGDLAALYNAFDVATLASRGEGFPNVVAEAMACGVPCVASDVGETAGIIGETGLVVPPHDAAALAAGWRTILDRMAVNGAAMRAAARQRVMERFGLDALAERSLDAFRSVMRD